METVWRDYEAWLQAHYPDGLCSLNAGASESVLSELEAQLKIRLPADYRAWLSIHNGQVDESAMLWSYEFYSSERVLSDWKLMVELAADITTVTISEPEGYIVPVWWHRNWIPITSDGSGNLQCLDLSPGPKGSVGQVIDFDHATLDRCVLANSFGDWVREYVSDVLAGEYAYSEEYGCLMEKGFCES